MTAFASSALLLVMAFGSAAPQTAAEIPTYAITGPTVIAFFAPVTDAELEKNPDTNEALSDFQLYASQVAPRMKRAGIHFEVASAVRFRLKNAGVTHTFTPAKTFVGYYLVAPGKKPRVEYGVLDDLSLMEIAKQYFRLPVQAR